MSFFSDLIFKPIIPFQTALIYGIILILIVLFNKKNVIIRILIILLLVIISQRPMLKNRDDIVYNMDLDVIFVIDNTVSMNAIDVNGISRLDALKNDCKHIMDRFLGANFAVITYANIAQIKYPFTSEVSIIEDIIDRMKIIDPNYAKGSALDLPYDYMKMLLESSRSKDKHKTIVFFMGDGELTASEAFNTDVSKYLNLKNMIDAGGVLGYGTSEGGKIKITDSIVKKNLVNSDGFLVNSKDGNVVFSRINEHNLNVLASNLGLDYYHMTDFSVLAEKINKIKDEANENDEGKEKLDKDIYYYFSFALLILLLIELFYCRRNEQ